MERIFPVESPSVAKVEIKSRGHVRRSRIYFLRDRSGKKARLRSKLRDLSGLISEEEAEALAGGSAEAVAEAEEAVAAEEAAAESTEEEAAAESNDEDEPADAAADEAEKKSD